MPELPTWDLSDIYDGIGDPGIIGNIREMTKRVESFESEYRGRIGAIASDLDRFLVLMRELEEAKDLS